MLIVIKNPTPAVIADPPVTANRLGHWDAAVVSSIQQSGGVLTQWNDKSGNARHLTPGNGPAYGSRSINGIVVPDFDGSNDYLLNTAIPYGTSNGDHTTSFFVGHNDAAAAAGHRGMLAGAVNFSNAFYLANQSGGLRVATDKRNGAGLGHLSSAAVGTASPFVAAQRIIEDPPHLVYHYQNSPPSSQSDNLAGGFDPNAGGILVGTYDAAGRYFDGGVAEIIFYGTNLTDQQVLDTLAYLEAKWATQ